MNNDKIILEGMVFYAYHGVLPEEKSLGQRFIVDVIMVTDLAAAAETDDLTKTINYSQAYQAVREIVEGPPKNLLEAVAGDVAARLLHDFPVQEVTVRIAKPSAPIKGATTVTPAIEITRGK
jgi:7,8-dihydroneopterin aldolase/epimerase/oxygenase